MTLALIARADSGGLGSQTYEFFRNMRPARTLVVLQRVARGYLRRDLYRSSKDHAVKFCMIHDIDKQVEWLCGGSTTAVYTAETFYSPRVAEYARHRGVRLFVHANPELWTEGDGGGTLWAPTEWALDRFPEGTPVVPFPVAVDRLAYRRRERAEVLFHMTAPAFHDRAGTEIVLASAKYLPDGMRLLVRGEPGPRWQQDRRGARVEWLPPVRDYINAIPDEADVMLAPRRYGGLALPVQEASARGIPSLMTNLSPQSHWFPEPLLAGPVYERSPVAMRGGTYMVHDMEARAYASRVKALVKDPGLVALLSDDVYGWALSRSWFAMEPEYRDRMGLESSP